jgi:hypothetical protein
MGDGRARAVRHMHRAAADNGATTSGRAQFCQSHPNRHRIHSCYSAWPLHRLFDVTATGHSLSRRTQNKALTAMPLTLNASLASSEIIVTAEWIWLMSHYETGGAPQVKA